MRHYFKNKILTAMLIACLLVLSLELPVYAADSGECGAAATWSLSGGVLTISGSGGMTNYEEHSMAPWYENRGEITSVVISEGITNIGTLAFYGCEGLKSVTLPSTIVSIESMAFAGCTSLSQVKLNEGLRAIGDNAFARCESLVSIQFPSTLTKIGYQGFYRCSSLTSVKVPYNVSILGGSAFAYCTSLVQATIESPIQTLPEWTFYGCEALTEISLSSTITEVGEYAFYDCDSLGSVYHDGLEEERESISEQINTQTEKEGEEAPAVIQGDASDMGSTKGETEEKDSENAITEKDTVVYETDNASISSTVSIKKPEKITADNKEVYDIEINANVLNEDGWQDVINESLNYASYDDKFADEDTEVNDVKVNVTLAADVPLTDSALQYMAGENISLAVSTSDGSEWIIECEKLNAEDITESYYLNYKMTKNENPTKEQKELIGYSESYIIEFAEDIPFPITLKLPFGYSYMRMYGSFCQKPIMGDWEELQTTLIDTYGNGYFYLDGVDTKTEYLVAINMAGVYTGDAIIPDTMADDYTLTDEYGNKYVLSGTKSSLGITFGQLTLIVAGIIVVSTIVVGVIVSMYFKARNKRQRMEMMQ